MSPSVIYGMLAGIGVLIFASQFHVAIDDKPHTHGLENLLAIPASIGKYSHYAVGRLRRAIPQTILTWARQWLVKKVIRDEWCVKRGERQIVTSDF